MSHLAHSDRSSPETVQSHRATTRQGRSLAELAAQTQQLPGSLSGFAYFPHGFLRHVEDLWSKAYAEDWTNERGQIGKLSNYINFSFKYITTTQKSKIKFSKDGTWAVYDTRLLSSFATGLLPIFALFQKNIQRDRQPYCFKGWCVGWGEVRKRAVDEEYNKMYGGTAPEPFSTELSTNDQPAWWKDFDSTLTVHADASHILSDNIERLRGIYTPSAAAPQKKCWLFFGTPNKNDLAAFFEEKQAKVKRVTFVASSLAYAEFNSPDDAAAMKERCIKEKIRIGGTICKPVFSQGPPSEGEVENIASDLTAALACAVRFAKLNPRRVLPQLFLPGGINSNNGFVRQLLLPLHLRKKPVADAALTIKLEPDLDNVGEDGELGWMYAASTVLTLDMAFNNARLVNSVESPWLCQSLRLHETQQANDLLRARIEDLELDAQAAHHQ